MQTAEKREREKQLVSEMIRLYCRGRHKTRNGLCVECRMLFHHPILALRHAAESKKERIGQKG